MTALRDDNPPPTECGKEFTAKSSGATESAAQRSNQSKANNLCKRLEKGCDRAFEVPGSATSEAKNGLVIYKAKYVCAPEP